MSQYTVEHTHTECEIEYEVLLHFDVPDLGYRGNAHEMPSGLEIDIRSVTLLGMVSYAWQDDQGIRLEIAEEDCDKDSIIERALLSWLHNDSDAIAACVKEYEREHEPENVA